MKKETIDKVLQDIAKQRLKILEEFSKAYIAETGCNPSEVELVEQQRPFGVSFYFRKKEPLND